RGRDGGGGRQPGRLPRDPGGDGRDQGGQGQLAGVPALPQGARAQGRAAVRLGQVPGAGGVAGRVLPRGGLGAGRGAFLPQRVHGGAQGEGQGGGGHAQGHPRPGGPPGGAAEGPAGGREAQGDAARQGGGGGGAGDRGDAGVHGVPAGALAADPDQQRSGAA